MIIGHEQITFNELEMRPLPEPPIYVPSKRAGQRRFEQIYGSLLGDQQAIGLTDIQMQALSKIARASAREEEGRVQKLSELTAAHKVDEALAEIQGDILRGSLRFEQKKDLAICLFDVRRAIRVDIDNDRRRGIYETQRSYQEFEIEGEEAYLRDSFRVSEKARGEVRVPAEVAEYVFVKMKIGGFKSFADFDKKTANHYWHSFHPSSSWSSGYESNIPGVVFTVTKLLGANEVSTGASLKIQYEQKAFKDNYRWFDTTKPMSIPEL
jgi:hypothetical protein